MMLVFQTSYSQISCDLFYYFFFFSDQNQETHSTLNKLKEDGLSLMVSFWASSTYCFCVFLYSCLLFCFVCLFFFFLPVKSIETKTVYRPSIFLLEILERAYKNKNRGDLLTQRAMGWS